MSFSQEPPDFSRFSDDLLAALAHNEQAAERVLSTIHGWLGAHPWQVWQTFLHGHPPDAVPLVDLSGPLLARALMVAPRIPETVAPAAPRPADRLVKASEQWIYTHTQRTIERAVQIQFLNSAHRLKRCYSPEQVYDFRREAVQESWAAFFGSHCERWDGRKAGLRTWAFILARGRASDYLRRLLRREEKEEPSAMQAEEEPRDQLDPLTERGILGSDLDRFLQTLLPEQRVLFHFFLIEGLTGAEIAAKVGSTPGAVYRELRSIMVQLGTFFSD